MKTKHKLALQILLSLNEKFSHVKNVQNNFYQMMFLRSMQNPCVTCGIAFSTQGNLKRHILRKHETDIVEKNKELITCSQCVKSFSKNANLKRHMKEYHNVENEQKQQ